MSQKRKAPKDKNPNDTKEFHLKIELVPGPSWGTNLPSALGKYRWTKLRKELLTKQGPTCAICGSEDKPHGHEVWKYDEEKESGKATLVRIEIICRMCHSVHHYAPVAPPQ